MKRFFAFAALLLLSGAAASAQIGIVGGFTSSKTGIDTKDLKGNLKNVSLYHAGVAYRVKLGNIVALQPALTYQVKGGNLYAANSGTEFAQSVQTKTGFLELGVGVHAGMDLLVLRPFLAVEPFIGYAVANLDQYKDGGVVTKVKEATKDVKSKLEYGFGVGGGIEILDHIQISVQWFMNLGNLYKDNGEVNASKDAFLAAAKDTKNYQGVKVTLGIFF